ncbi:MAG: 5-hydroxyisourate hydrolase [Herpetosiphonaceae bacterium]|nr:MAG: 5-hydroxyisourate hydrolase [Herpetosiphonaceae bacterium]
MTTHRQPSISTHVLDLETGQPAAGVPVSLSRLEGEQFVLQSRQETNDDGRIASLLPDALQPGTYRLYFDVAAYLQRRGAGETFITNVTIEFHIQDTGRHYHIPLLVSRYSCASYRGS